MREIVKAKPLPKLVGWLFCEFDNGEKLFVDIKPSMKGVLEKLKEMDFFNEVFVDNEAGTVCWPDELHIDPDTLYSRGIQIHDVKQLAKFVKEENNEDWLERA